MRPCQRDSVRLDADLHWRRLNYANFVCRSCLDTLYLLSVVSSNTSARWKWSGGPHPGWEINSSWGGSSTEEALLRPANCSSALDDSFSSLCFTTKCCHVFEHRKNKIYFVEKRCSWRSNTLGGPSCSGLSCSDPVPTSAVVSKCCSSTHMGNFVHHPELLAVLCSA